MSSPLWPATLPQAPLASNYSETGEGALVRSAPELGPAMVRRRYSRQVVTYQISLALTDAQRATFFTFVDTTTEGGVLWFDWIDFTTRATQSYRFVIPPRPTVVALGPGLWRVDFQLEALL